MGSFFSHFMRSFINISLIRKIYERILWNNIKNGKKPCHVGVILDGNRRWASTHGFSSSIGHNFGAEKVEELLYWCMDFGIKILTIYVFSTENFDRQSHEVNEIMNLFRTKLEEALYDNRIEDNEINIKALGRIHLLPENVLKLVRKVEKKTEFYNRFYLNIAIAYGGRAEIVDATRKIAEKIQSGELLPNDINEDLFEKNLYTSHLPESNPDIIIRTSGEERLSGFLLWQSAYSELIFLDVYWPDFRKIDFWRSIRTYQSRTRRYGK
jgi:tritrans,polycis-undecaprenyl-diphosphate synthase [geranylgeranyl-diphosphate specific]